MHTTESASRGYRTNRAALVRMEEIKRKLSENPRHSLPKIRPPSNTEPSSRYAYSKRGTREKKQLEEDNGSSISEASKKSVQWQLKKKLHENTLAYILKRRQLCMPALIRSHPDWTKYTVYFSGLESNDDMRWMLRAQEVLKNRGSPTCSEKKAYEQAEELTRLQRAVQSKKILKEKLDRISSEIAALTGNVIKEDSDESSTTSTSTNEDDK